MREYNMIDGYDPFYTGEPIKQRLPISYDTRFAALSSRIEAFEKVVFVGQPEDKIENGNLALSAQKTCGLKE